MQIKCHRALHSNYYDCRFALIFFVKKLQISSDLTFFSSKKAHSILSCAATFSTSSNTSCNFLTNNNFLKKTLKNKTAFKKAHSSNRFIVIIIQIIVLFDVISHFKDKSEQKIIYLTK